MAATFTENTANAKFPNLETVVARQMLPTPNAFDAVPNFGNRKDNNLDQGGRHGVSLRHIVSGRLNPRWVEWLMGFPPNWLSLDSEPSETPSCPSRSTRSSKPSRTASKEVPNA